MVTNAQLQTKYKRRKREGFPFEFKGELMAISKETANKLLQGEFKTFEDFRNHADNNLDIYNRNVEVLYRKLPYDETLDKTNYVIETIFINE